MLASWLERSQGDLEEAFARRLSVRTGSLFRAQGELVCRELARAVVLAMREDLAAGKREALRVALLQLVERFASQGLGFSDIRYYAQSLRTIVLASVDADGTVTGASRRLVEDWLYEALLVASMRFLTLREQQIQERAAQQEVQQLERQIGELRSAYEEKMRLLDVIRQASTPIAPVVEGILVVPLVGVFDTFRAQLLTEKLLQAVAKSQAQVVIVDISGVPIFDAEAAQLVIKLALAVRLLGTELLLVGLSSEIARTIVQSGVGLGGLQTLGTLQDGLAVALAQRRLKIGPLTPKPEPAKPEPPKAPAKPGVELLARPAVKPPPRRGD